MVKEFPQARSFLRGIAGSGKTVVLCQKAAWTHLQHPEWDIALVFFTRSLYDLVIGQVKLWLHHFSKGEVQYESQNSKLRVFHAWGTKDQPGLYRTICKAHNIKPFPLNRSCNYTPPEMVADVVIQLLKATEITPMFDAILIDEGQDLVVGDELKYNGKQPIYWMAWQALRPVDPQHPEKRRLIWVYDEAQTLHGLKVPTAKELFGEELSNIVVGAHKGGIQKSAVMKTCYRTPAPILTAAHAIGMGLLRPEGMLSGFTKKKDWEGIGYEVTGNFCNGQQITLHRPWQHSPNPVPALWEKPVLEFEMYESREAELTALAHNIRQNLEVEGLKPSRDILVVVLGANAEEAMEQETEVAGFLKDRGIDIYIPTAQKINDLERDNDSRNQFWREGGVTVSLIHRAKGNEADLVYVVGFDSVARDESNINLRNSLFVALTRARGWVKLSGAGSYPMCDEMRRVIAGGNTFSFTYKRPPQWNISSNYSGSQLDKPPV